MQARLKDDKINTEVCTNRLNLAEGEKIMEDLEIRRRKIKVIDSAQHSDYISDTDAEMDKRAVAAVRAAISKAEVCKKPVAKYDINKKQAYLEYPDGRRDYVG